jgi:hypothetical protein
MKKLIFVVLLVLGVLVAHAQIRQQRFIVLPYHYSDQVPSATVSQIEGTWQQAASFWNQVSYGQVNVAYTVLPWYKINRPSSECKTYDARPEFEAYMRSLVPTYDTYNQFARIMLVSSCIGGNSGTTAMVINSDGSMTSVMQMVGYGTSVPVTSHEMGHALMEQTVRQGLGHSNSFSGTGGVYVTTDYGEFNDMMGHNVLQLNSGQRSNAGWYSPEDVVTTSTSATFQMYNVDNFSGLRCVRVPRIVTISGTITDGHIVFDYKAGRGVSLRFVPIPVTFKGIAMSNKTHLIRNIPVGQVWSDTELGIGVSVFSGDAQSTTFNVSVNEVPPPILDIEPPQIAYVSPADSSTATGIINVTVNATDNVGVVSVQHFAVDGQPMSSVLASPFVWTIDTRTISNGIHSWYGIVKDAAQNVNRSPLLMVVVDNVQDETPPVAAILSPTNGQTITRRTSYPIRVTFSDPESGIQSAGVTVNGSLIGTLTTSGTVRWSVPGAPGRDYRIALIVTNNANRSTTIYVSVRSGR